MEKAGTDGLSGNDPARALERISRYCAYQERCTREVEDKLREWKVPAPKAKSILEKLADGGFFDDARFARIFTGSKFRHNKWGRVKIRYELKSRGIQENIIAESMQAISGDEYLETIRELILKKQREIKTGKNLNIREKIITFVNGKGYEFDLIAQALKELKI
jgi:regulatory protein